MSQKLRWAEAQISDSEIEEVPREGGDWLIPRPSGCQHQIRNGTEGSGLDN